MQKYAVDLDKSFPNPYSNEYLLPKIGGDTAEDEPLKVPDSFRECTYKTNYMLIPITCNFAYI